MQSDPFGNLRDWGPVLERIHQLSDDGNLKEYQAGLIRILRYRDNWRLREEVLSRVGTINNPNDPLVLQVLDIVTDENLYYEVRILACSTMVEFLKNGTNSFAAEVRKEVQQTVENLLSMQHPPIFTQALKKLYSVARERFSIS